MDIVSLLDRLLVCAPLQNGASFLDGESREDQMRIVGLPGQRLSFIQGQAKEVLRGAELVLEFGAEGLLRGADASNELSKAVGAGCGGPMSELFGCFDELHNSFP
jgi:hypothetical protein